MGVRSFFALLCLFGLSRWLCVACGTVCHSGSMCFLLFACLVRL